MLHVRASLESVHLMPGRPDYARLVFGESSDEHPVSEVLINPESLGVTFDGKALGNAADLLDYIVANRHIRVEFDYEETDSHQTTSGTQIIVTIQDVVFTTCESASEI